MATFDLGGLLGNAFGGPSALDDLLTEEQRAAIQRQGALSAAAALLQAAGPSTTRTSLGQALGSAFTAGQAGMQKGQESALTQMLTRQKLEEARRGQTLQANIAKILMGEAPTAAAAPSGEITPEEALAAPGMAAGPTVARAGLIGQPRPQAAAEALSPNELKARQYRQVADVYAANGRGEEAKRFMEIADALAPTRQEVVGEPIKTATGYVMRTKTGGFIPVPEQYAPTAEVMGQPFEVSTPDGKAVMVQQFKDGSIKTIEGFGPKREMVLQTVDGKVQAIDKSKLTGTETFGTGMTPAERARIEIEQAQLKIAQQRLGLSQAEFARGQYERMDTAQGIMYVPKTPGFQPIPILDAAGKPLTSAGAKPSEGESNAAGFATRMERVDQILGGLTSQAAPGTLSAIAGSIPIVGPILQRGAQSDAQQQYQQAAQDWIRAKLRKESGAAIGKDEMEQEYRTYFPQIGDSAAVLAQKEQARAVATAAMKRSAGRAYEPYVAPAPPATPPAANRPAAAQEGAVSADRSGRAIVFRNGQWVYQ